MTLVNYECGMLKGRRPDYHPMDMLQFVYFRFGASHTLYIYMTQCRILGKFEYTGGPIFKVVLEC